MNYAHGHPLDDKAALAEWMKYPSVEAMDADHDRLHQLLCDLLVVPSHSMRQAAGKPANDDLAACEEAAVLHVQRWLQWLRVEQ